LIGLLDIESLQLGLQLNIFFALLAAAAALFLLELAITSRPLFAAALRAASASRYSRGAAARSDKPLRSGSLPGRRACELRVAARVGALVKEQASQGAEAEALSSAADEALHSPPCGHVATSRVSLVRVEARAGLSEVDVSLQDEEPHGNGYDELALSTSPVHN